MMAMMSATRWPGVSRPTVCRLKYEGSWMRSRKGWSEPSLMAYAAYWPRGLSRATQARPGGHAQQARQLGHDRPVGHLVQHLVDDAQSSA